MFRFPSNLLAVFWSESPFGIASIAASLALQFAHNSIRHVPGTTIPWPRSAHLGAGDSAVARTPCRLSVKKTFTNKQNITKTKSALLLV